MKEPKDVLRFIFGVSDQQEAGNPSVQAGSELINDSSQSCVSRGFSLTIALEWGRSSVGRALEWHSRGRGFDSHRLHQFKTVYRTLREMVLSRGGVFTVIDSL
jgi:hypothetical protein